MVATWTGGSGRLRQTGARAGAAGRPNVRAFWREKSTRRPPAGACPGKSDSVPSDQLRFGINFAMTKVGTSLSGLWRKWLDGNLARYNKLRHAPSRTYYRAYARRRRLRCGRESVVRPYKARQEWRESAAEAESSRGHATCPVTGTHGKTPRLI